MTDEEIAEQYSQLPPTDLPLPYRKKINIDKVLGIISQSNHIMISKNLTNEQMGLMIENINDLIRFVRKDHYIDRSIFLELFGIKKEN